MVIWGGWVQAETRAHAKGLEVMGRNLACVRSGEEASEGSQRGSRGVHNAGLLCPPVGVGEGARIVSEVNPRPRCRLTGMWN